MADNVQLNSPTTSGAVIASDDISGVQHQLVKQEFGTDGNATMVSASDPLPVTDAAAGASLVSILAKLSADPATQTTLAAILAKIIAAPSTEAQQITANALLTTIAAITQPLTDTQLRATPVPISGTVAVSGLPAGLATSANQTTEISGLAALLAELQLKADLTETQPVSVASLPLPSGAATAANQATEITSLSSVDTKLTSQATATKQDAQTALLTTIDGDTANLDVALSTRLKPADTLAGVTAVGSITNPVTVIQPTAANLNVTEASAAAILAKIIAAPATELKQDDEITQLTALNAKDFATQTTLAAFYAALGLSQGSDGSAAIGPMVQGLVNDVPSSYIAGQLQPLSLTSEGRLRVSAVPADIQKIWNGTFGYPFYENDLYASSLNFFY